MHGRVEEVIKIDVKVRYETGLGLVGLSQIKYRGL